MPYRLGDTMADNDDNTGFNVIPKRYLTPQGREAIDIIRDSMTDEEFIVYCRGQALKYQLRLGKKGSDDAEKIRWYLEMVEHVARGAPDPRSVRPGFQIYTRRAAW